MRPQDKPLGISSEIWEDLKYKREVGICDTDQSQNNMDRESVTQLSHVRMCEECKRNPVTGRAKTCGTTCRKRRERRQKEASAASIMALHELGKIRDSLKRREMRSKLILDLRRLKDEINDLLLLAGDTEALSRQQMLEDRARRQS